MIGRGVLETALNIFQASSRALRCSTCWFGSTIKNSRDLDAKQEAMRGYMKSQTNELIEGDFVRCVYGGSGIGIIYMVERAVRYVSGSYRSTIVHIKPVYADFFEGTKGRKKRKLAADWCQKVDLDAELVRLQECTKQIERLKALGGKVLDE